MKNVIVFRLAAPIEMHPRDLEAAMSKLTHQKPSPLSWNSSGFVPPLGREGDLLEDLGSEMYLLALKTSKRDLPSSVINDALTEKVAQIEEQEDRSLQKAERQRVKTALVDKMLPKSFVKNSLTLAILTNRFIYVDATSPARGEEVLHHLRSAIGSLKVYTLTVENPIAVELSQWITDGGTPIEGTVVSDQSLKLASASETETVAYRNIDPFDEAVKEHITRDGYRVIEIQLRRERDMTYRLNDSLHLRAIKWDAAIKDQAHTDAGEDDHELTIGRATWLLYASVVDCAVGELIEAFGGMPELVGTEQEEDAETDDDDDDDGDEMYEHVESYVLLSQVIDPEDLKGEFDLSTSRTAKLIERLERAGVVSAMDEAGERRVIKTIATVDDEDLV